MRRSTLAFLIFLILAIAAAAYIDAPNNGGLHVGPFQNDFKITEGLDLQGGVQVLLQAQGNYSNSQLSASMPAAVNALDRRVNSGLGVKEPIIRQEGSNRISVELPGLKNEDQAVQQLLKTGNLEFIDTKGQPLQVGSTVPEGQYTVEFTGKSLDPNSLNVALDPQTAQPEIQFAMQGSDVQKFAQYTQQNVGNYLTVTLDGTVIESAVIQSQITGQGVINGNMTLDQANKITQLLKYGALPINLTIVSESNIGPTLGAQSIQASFIAAIIGLGMVILFMLIYYRLPGLLADMALLIYTLWTFAIFKLFGVTLTLAGIAGFILSIGMAVDANVLIFERIKEELRHGRTLAAAIDLGFKRAWSSIRDSNISTFITCGILFIFGNNFGASIIVGFATTLAIGVACSLFTATFVTRFFMDLLIPTGIISHPWFFGLPADSIKVPTFNRAKPALVAEE